MMNTEQYREHIERTFNAFCKIVLYHAALNAYKKLRKKQQFEVSLDYLREFDFEPVTTTDEYFVKYDVPTVFTVRGETVIVESEQLAAAGEPEAVKTVIQTYTGYIKYLSYFQGSINDDIQDYLKASLMEALPKFRFDS